MFYLLIVSRCPTFILFPLILFHFLIFEMETLYLAAIRPKVSPFNTLWITFFFPVVANLSPFNNSGKGFSRLDSC